MLKDVSKYKIFIIIIVIIILILSIFFIPKFLIPYIHYICLPREKLDLGDIDKATISIYEYIYMEETDEYIQNKIMEVVYKLPNSFIENIKSKQFVNYDIDYDDFGKLNHEVILNDNNKFYFSYYYDELRTLSNNKSYSVIWHTNEKNFKTTLPESFISSLTQYVIDILETNYIENFSTNSLTINSKSKTKEETNKLRSS